MKHEPAIRDLETLIRLLETQRKEYPLLSGTPEEKAVHMASADAIQDDISSLRHSIELLRQDSATAEHKESAHV